ncbi:hypothetical protein [Micromonospora sagamiensis]|uniref:Secreted protein n=1 Tax=Micromonospora sagamiensis TaxID=47875 RepID=A0A562WJ52_9ACTN|nr:hypothetical protein [Micromonospora sagamiensis]TWJ30286.1 hypothetical protein JD81_03824 [Micromonospora sagamiensis]BCL16684.1 hypothetical protein GCM10017556_44230 [Micromonospora sagamiensis]
MRRRLTGVLLALPLAAALGLAGCSGGDRDDEGVATAGGGGARPTLTAVALSDEERRIRFTRCLREQGLDVADPEPGQNGPRFKPGSNVDRTKVQAALQACREYAPNGGQPRQLNADQVEQVRKLARCMRENGVPNFPDPDADGRIQPGKADIDRQDPAVRAAFDKCREVVPNLDNRLGTP